MADQCQTVWSVIGQSRMPPAGLYYQPSFREILKSPDTCIFYRQCIGMFSTIISLLGLLHFAIRNA